MNAWTQAAAWAAALALTLALAAVLTPRAWWRRPNLRALAIVAGGTLGFATLFGLWSGHAAAPAPVGAAPVLALQAVPAAGVRYRAVDQLNLRVGTGVGSPRLRVLDAGTIVTATGQAERDWWRVRTRVDGAELEGWASSLWLRRADEAGAPRLQVK